MTIKEIEKLVDGNELEIALVLIDEMESAQADSIEKHLLKARIFHKQQRFGEAINEYFKVLELDPENTKARTGIDLIEGILGFFNTDMYNP